jgi:hypothetical protein
MAGTFQGLKHADRQSGRWMAALGLAFLLLTWPAILAGGGGTSQAADLTDYHLVEIRRLAGQLPAPDLRDAFSATTPGFHLGMAMLERAGASLTAMRITASLVALAGVLILWRVAAAWAGPRVATWVALPFTVSPYLLGATVWMTTESAACTLVIATAGVGLLAPCRGHWGIVVGLLSAGAVLVRQILVWSCVPWLVRVIAARGLRSGGGLLAAGVAPATLVIAAFFTLWGGTTPPRFREFVQSAGNPTAWVFCAAAMGAASLPLLPGLWARVDRAGRRRCVMAACVAMAIALLVPTSFRRVLPPLSQLQGTPAERAELPADAVVGAHEIGRWGGPLWDAAARLPAPGDRSLLITSLAGLGAAAMAMLLAAAAARGRRVEAWGVTLMLASMATAQAANAQTFQRYFDPWVLLALGWLVAMGWGGAGRGDRWCAAGLLLLSLAQLVMSVRAVLAPAFTGPALAS